jgi:hypothetical protein
MCLMVTMPLPYSQKTRALPDISQVNGVRHIDDRQWVETFNVGKSCEMLFISFHIQHCTRGPVWPCGECMFVEVLCDRVLGCLDQGKVHFLLILKWQVMGIKCSR